MRHFKTKKGAFKRKLTKFGDLITFDFVDMGKATEMGWRDHKELLVIIRDRYTGMERKVICAYSDSALSFKAAMNEMGIPLDKSLLEEVSGTALPNGTTCSFLILRPHAFCVRGC